MSLKVKVYKMLGASPAPLTDYYLGDATYMGGGVFNFQLPPTTSDFQFYYFGIDEAGNEAPSSVYTYYNGIDAIMFRTSIGDEFALVKDYDGFLRIRS